MDPRSRDLVVRLTALMETINAGEPGLPALDLLLDLAQDAVGAVGMAAFELAENDGRIIAANGEVAFTLGRRIDANAPRAMRVRTGERVQELLLAESETPVSIELVDLGIGLAVAARAAIGGELVGALAAYYRQDERRDDPDEHLVMQLLANTMAHLYRDRTGLPVHGNGPVDPRPADLPERELFMAVTSHELRTPVTVIKGYADTLTRHWAVLEEADRVSAARVISQRASELARLVDRLLTTATVGGPGWSPGRFDLVAALRQATFDLPADLRDRLELALPHELLIAYGERGSIATVLTELVTNADKYSPGPEKVTLTAGADQRTIFFRVADRGVGVPEDQTETAFHRFWRARPEDSSRSGGAGLGLYLVRKTIERQNGWVSLRPRDGGGTVAEVRLPRGDKPYSDGERL
ncbi:signal transduction histidine kinase [Allocatelliglobosispora scoriae]|uniref:histidine kinase n=1 Tax=Allocatelliglobosispora scoriae TaxID=643052 RepID=A0A841BT28_9ACTN|nr:signal transduction histidine kinase [Allocatelliglobosispora scoriae]